MPDSSVSLIVQGDWKYDLYESPGYYHYWSHLNRYREPEKDGRILTASEFDCYIVATKRVWKDKPKDGTSGYKRLNLKFDAKAMPPRGLHLMEERRLERGLSVLGLDRHLVHQAKHYRYTWARGPEDGRKLGKRLHHCACF